MWETGRFLLQVLEEVKRTVGPDCPVLAKMNSEDFPDGGLSRDESLEVAVIIEERGIDAIELNGETLRLRQADSFKDGDRSRARRGLLQGSRKGV